MAAIWDGDLDLSSNQVSVLLCLADHSNDDGLSCYPSIARIAKRTRLSERTVQRCIAELEASRVIAAERGGGRHNTTNYVLNAAMIHAHASTKGDTKGDTVTPFVAERVTNVHGKGDTVTPDPSLEPPIVSSPASQDEPEILQDSLLAIPEVPVPKKVTMRKESVLTQQWREFLMPVLYGHTNHDLLNGRHYGEMKKLVEKLDKAGCTTEIVVGALENVWRKEFPGDRGALPRSDQLLDVVGRWMARKVDPAPGVAESDVVLVTVDDGYDW